MDLSRFETKTGMELGTDMPLRDPETNKPLVDGEGKPLTLRIRGAESSVYKDRVRRRLNKKKAGGEPEPEQLSDEYIIEELLTLTVGWSGNLGFDGKDHVPFTPDSARQFYDGYRIFRMQAWNWFISDLSFMSASSKS